MEMKGVENIQMKHTEEINRLNRASFARFSVLSECRKASKASAVPLGMRFTGEKVNIA